MLSEREWWALRARNEVIKTGTMSLSTVMQLTRLGVDAASIEKEHKK